MENILLVGQTWVWISIFHIFHYSKGQNTLPVRSHVTCPEMAPFEYVLPKSDVLQKHFFVLEYHVKYLAAPWLVSQYARQTSALDCLGYPVLMLELWYFISSSNGQPLLKSLHPGHLQWASLIPHHPTEEQQGLSLSGSHCPGLPLPSWSGYCWPHWPSGRQRSGPEPLYQLNHESILTYVIKLPSTSTRYMFIMQFPPHLKDESPGQLMSQLDSSIILLSSG